MLRVLTRKVAQPQKQVKKASFQRPTCVVGGLSVCSGERAGTQLRAALPDVGRGSKAGAGCEHPTPGPCGSQP